MCDPLFIPRLFFIYLPHLDYAAQKNGPDSPEALQAVGELDNVIEHSMILADGNWITLDDLPLSLRGDHAAPPFTHNLKEAVAQFEKQHIQQVLEEVNGDRKEAAHLLAVSLSSLYRKIEELSIS